MYTCKYCEKPVDWDEFVEVYGGYAHIDCYRDETEYWADKVADDQWQLRKEG